VCLLVIAQHIEKVSSYLLVPEHVVLVVISSLHLRISCFPHFSAVEWPLPAP
jgi:hypothetical protein